MKRLCICLFLCSLMLSSNARAIDPGTATGSLTVGAHSVKLTHSYSHLHDNAEKWLDTPREMRILLSDREVPESSIAGLNVFMTVSEMVRQDKVRGVLLRFDPAKPKSILATVLYPAKDPQEALSNETMANSSTSPIDKLAISAQRVSGAIAHHRDGSVDFGWPAMDYKAEFSAPLFTEPAVTATLTGKQALDSVQGKALAAKAKALGKGDFKAAQQYATARANQQMEAFMSQAGPEAPKIARQMGAEMERELKKGKLRLVVRGTTAALLIGEKGASLITFVQEGDAWKVD